MKLLIHLTFCFAFVVCIPRNQVIITILDESGPAPMPNIYQSGPVVSEEASANKRPRLFRTGIQDTEYPQYPDGDGEYPEDSGEYPENPGEYPEDSEEPQWYPEDPFPAPQFPEESRGNLGIN